jgi:hypothetical protein
LPGRKLKVAQAGGKVKKEPLGRCCMDFEKLLEEWVAAFAQVAEESLASLETALMELAEHLAVPLQETLRQWEALWNLEEEVELEPEPEPFEETLNPSGESFTTSRFFVSPIGFGGVVVYTYVASPPEYIGDPTCRYNAHSPELRCAVNPCGPCEGCPHYEPRNEPQ